MKRIIPGFENLPRKEIGDCRVTSYKELLAYYGITLDPLHVNLLMGGISFYFGRVITPELNEMDIWLGGSDVISIEDELQKNISLPIKKHIINDDDAGLKEFIGFVDNNIPLLVEFDNRYIFGKRELNIPISVLNIYYPSLTVFVGYDLDNQVAYILNYDRGKTNLCGVNLKRFLGFRNEKYLPVSPGNVCYQLNINEQYINWFKANQKALLKKSILNTCDRMLGNGEYDASHIEAEILESYQGIEGMRRFCQAVSSFWQEIKEQTPTQIINRIFVVKFLVFRSFFLQTSSTCNREEFGKSLLFAADALDIPALSISGEGFINVGAEWRVLIRTIFHIKDMLNNKQEFIEDVLNKMQSIINTEESLLSEIRYSLSID